jgi:hypothetical protein
VKARFTLMVVVLGALLLALMVAEGTGWPGG